MKSTVQPLESAQLIEYAQPIDCYVCDGQNNSNAEFCRYCLAPMALAHQARGGKSRPQMIAVIGATGAGKTVYLGMLLDMLAGRPERLQVVARGAFSINLQQTTTAALTRCRFPEKTPNEPERWNWAHCQIRRPRQRRGLDLIFPDMSGEAINEEVNHPQSYRVIRSFLEKCSGALVLIDAARLRKDGRDADYFNVKLLSYLGELGEEATQGWKKKPVALVLTKADQCEECRKDPGGYIQSRAVSLWQYCCERFNAYQFFAASVAGACAFRDTPDRGRVQVPLRIEPHGLVEPFEWLLDQMK
jgi:hypothetical protein